MGEINWIIWVGSKCNHKGTYKNETEDLTQRKSHVKEAKGNGVHRRCYTTGFEDGRREHEPKDAPLQAGKDEETHCPLDLPKEAQP